MKRKLISLSKADWQKEWYVSFAYYDDDGGYLGVSENCHIAEDTLYKVLKPLLVKEISDDPRHVERRKASNCEVTI